MQKEQLTNMPVPVLFLFIVFFQCAPQSPFSDLWWTLVDTDLHQSAGFSAQHTCALSEAHILTSKPRRMMFAC